LVTVAVVLVRIVESEHETKNRDAERTLILLVGPECGHSTGSARRTRGGAVVIEMGGGGSKWVVRD
jgi:hypothetical protein